MQVRKTKKEHGREISAMSFKSRRINNKIYHISGGWPGGPGGFVRWYFSSEKNISRHYPLRPAGSHLYEHAVLHIWDQTLSSLVRECGQSVEKYYYSWLKSGRYSSKIRAHDTNYQTRWNMTRSGRSKKNAPATPQVFWLHFKNSGHSCLGSYYFWKDKIRVIVANFINQCESVSRVKNIYIALELYVYLYVYIGKKQVCD